MFKNVRTIAFLLLIAPCLFLLAGGSFVTAQQPPPDPDSVLSLCASESHAHTRSDFKLAWVTVDEVDECSFTFHTDLIAETSVRFGDERFAGNVIKMPLGSVAMETNGVPTAYKVFMPGLLDSLPPLIDRTEVSPGFFGLMLYCTNCKTGAFFKPPVPA